MGTPPPGLVHIAFQIFLEADTATVSPLVVWTALASFDNLFQFGLGEAFGILDRRAMKLYSHDFACFRKDKKKNYSIARIAI
jgi:hypothetical protein